MKTKLILFVALLVFFGIGILLQKSKVVYATSDLTPSPTIGAPKVVFSIGYTSSSGAVYQPREGEICKLRHSMSSSYLGSLSPNLSMLVVKFTSDAYQAIPANWVVCESASIYSPYERMVWYFSLPENNGLNIQNSRAVYVDGETMKEVTLTSTASSTPTQTPTLGTVTPTPVPIPFTWEDLVLVTDDKSTADEFYSPGVNTICWTWDPVNGKLGKHRLSSGKKLLVVKYLATQSNLPFVMAACQISNSTLPENVASFYNNGGNGIPWSQIETYYVGSNSDIVTLTPTSSVTNTPYPTMTPTVTSTKTSTFIPTSTETVTSSSTSTATVTTTSTTTVTPVLGPDKTVPANTSTIHVPKVGHICFGQVVGAVRNSVVEYVSDFSTGVELTGGGCFTKKYFSLSQVLTYLESRGIKYKYVALPKPTSSPTRTMPPTATIVRNLVISFIADGTRDFLVTEPGTVCWGRRVGGFLNKSVRFQRSLSNSIKITSGGCTAGLNLSAEDVYNFLRRTQNTPLNGFVEVN